jgi:hypothetical protein
LAAFNHFLFRVFWIWDQVSEQPQKVFVLTTFQYLSFIFWAFLEGIVV